MTFDLSDYVDVPERIRLFADKHPDGSLRAEVIHWPTTEVPFIAVKAEAFRSPMDEAPGVGLAWEPFPGTTPYTKKSELQNAETSAWGRAIVAVLAADSKRGIASQDEVRNRRDDWDAVETTIKASGGESRPFSGEGAVSAPPPGSSGSEEGIGVSSLSGQASSGAGPTASQELWAEARAAGVTATKAMKALRDEGVEVASSAEITDVQLRDLMQRVNA
jgi:hypothetical protein